MTSLPRSSQEASQRGSKLPSELTSKQALCLIESLCMFSCDGVISTELRKRSRSVLEIFA